MGREEARRIYERITRRRKDPGIVEVGRQGIQTRIFPIPAGGDMRVKTRYARVFGRIVGAGAPVAVLRARVGREPIELRATPASAGDTKFVAGIWAVSRIDDILGRRGGSRPEKEAEAVELSRRLGILTERTAILAR